MQKAEPQQANVQNQTAAKKTGNDAVVPAQSEETAQLEAMIETSPEMQRMNRMAAMMNSAPVTNSNPARAAQLRMMNMVANAQQPALQRMAEMIHNSPRQLAAQKESDDINNSPTMVQQRKKMESLFGVAQRVEDEEALQGKFETAQRVEEDEALQGKFETVQRVEEEEPLQGKCESIQCVEEEEPLQGKFATESPAQTEHHQDIKQNKTGLPDSLKAGVESLSGMSLDNVKVHYNSAQPAQLNALAYAQGSDIHIAPGQEQHLPHEAWHIVQQAQGRVQPTMQMKDGVPVNDDAGLEREADVMGARALQLTGSGAAALPTVQARATMPSQALLQLRTIKDKGIAGLTHLVALTNEGHIYNRAWQANEREEVSHGDRLAVDIDSGLMSRRGMHQELNAPRDEIRPKDQLWFEAIALNGDALPPDRYVRNEMLFDPPVIEIPRSSEGLAGAIKQLVNVLLLWQTSLVGDSKQADGPIQELRNFVATLQPTIAVPVDLEARGQALGLALAQIEGLAVEGAQECVLKVRDQYAQYKQPKQRVGGGGKLNRDMLMQLGIKGLDLGGIGLVKGKGMLDINVNDEVNDSNFLLIGDAMRLPEMFEEDCVDTVLAKLLPLVLMESSATVEARRLVVDRVLAGVVHVCKKNGAVEINFNDNSEPGRLNERELLALAARHGFTLEPQFARPTVTLSALSGGIGMLGKKKEASSSSGEQTKKLPPVKLPPPEPLYRWFTFNR